MKFIHILFFSIIAVFPSSSLVQAETTILTAVENYDPDCKLKQGWGFAGKGQLNFEVTSSNVTLLPEAAGLFHRLSGTP
jgi:hypothetical protein